MKVKVKSLNRVRLFVTPWTAVHQAPPSMEFSRQEYWSGLPFPSPPDLPSPGIVEVNLTWVFCNLVAESNLPDTYFILSLRMNSIMLQSSVQFTGSVMSDSATRWTAAHQASLSITNSWSLLKLMSIESVMPSSHLIPCLPLLCFQSFPASGSFQVSQFFASGGQNIGVSASTSVLPMNIQD